MPEPYVTVEGVDGADRRVEEVVPLLHTTRARRAHARSERAQSLGGRQQQLDLCLHRPTAGKNRPYQVVSTNQQASHPPVYCTYSDTSRVR
eukprot:scaffold216005_cov30-Tisochrysis_lutea.AAC.3